jgi:hypothetical protein
MPCPYNLRPLRSLRLKKSLFSASFVLGRDESRPYLLPFVLLCLRIFVARANLLATVTVENTRLYRAKHAKCAGPHNPPRVNLIF